MLKKEHFLKWKILSSISNATSKANPKHFNKTPNPQTFPFHLRDYFKLRDEHSGQHLHSTVSSAAWKGGGGLPRGSSQLPSQLPHELGTASNHHDFEQLLRHSFRCIFWVPDRRLCGLVCRTAEHLESLPRAARATV